MDCVCVSSRSIVWFIKVNVVCTIFIQELRTWWVRLNLGTKPEKQTQVAARPETPDPTTATFIRRCEQSSCPRSQRAVASITLFMPKELPGFYWDEAKNRYFPISSKPKQSLPSPSDTHQKAQNHTESSKGVKSRLQCQRQCLSWNRNETIRTTDNHTQRLKASQ